MKMTSFRKSKYIFMVRLWQGFVAQRSKTLTVFLNVLDIPNQVVSYFFDTNIKLHSNVAIAGATRKALVIVRWTVLSSDNEHCLRLACKLYNSNDGVRKLFSSVRCVQSVISF